MKNLLIILGSILGAIVLFWVIVNIIPCKKVIEENPFIAKDKTMISAHRGGAILNPENTQKAFDYVIKETTYTDIVEIDVRTTKDGKLVVIHDETINRTGIKGEVAPLKINDLEYEQLKSFNLGVNFVDINGNKIYENYKPEQASAEGLVIITLEQFLIRYNEVRDFKLYLEIKEEGNIGIKAADKALELLNKYSWYKDRTMMISFSTTVVDHIIEVDKNQLVGALGYKIAPELVFGLLNLDSLYSANYHGFQTQTKNSLGPIKVNCATKRFVNMAHKRNQSITYWTINDQETMEKLVNIGVDVITTNAPDVLAQVLGKI